eukprot:2029140-Rhodomonas_salina.2
MSVGLQVPSLSLCAPGLAAARVRCSGKCKALYDAAGHHAQTCVCHSESLSAYYNRLRLGGWERTLNFKLQS